MWWTSFVCCQCRCANIVPYLLMSMQHVQNTIACIILWLYIYMYLFFIFRACGERPQAFCLMLVFSVVFVTSTVPTWYQAEWALYHLVRLDGYFADQLGLSDVNPEKFTPEDLLEPLASRQFWGWFRNLFCWSSRSKFWKKETTKKCFINLWIWSLSQFGLFGMQVNHSSQQMLSRFCLKTVNAIHWSDPMSRYDCFVMSNHSLKWLVSSLALR